jgi:hypothetical protein
VTGSGRTTDGPRGFAAVRDLRTMDPMTRITIEVPDDVAERIAAAAAERGVAAEELVGEMAVEQFPPRRKLGFASLGRSTSGRHASEDEDMLAEGFGR